MRNLFVSGLIIMALAGCSDPLQTIQPVEGPTDAQSAAIADPTEPIVAEPKKPLMQRLFKNKTANEPTLPEPPASEVATKTPAIETLAEPQPDQIDAAVKAALNDPAVTEQTKRKDGFLSRLRTRVRDKVEDAKIETDETRVAAMPNPDVQSDTTPAPIVTPKSEPAATKTRVFARKDRIKPDAPDYSIVPMGSVLAYGNIARVCDFKKSQLGKEIDKYPAKRPEFRLYDSYPGHSGPHAFFITGFPDKCARQFTASMAMLSTVGNYESIRYSGAVKNLPMGQADKAYNKVKTKICRTSAKKHCGDRIDKLEKNTVFITTYESLTSSSRWSAILLHDGTVLASEVK